MLLFDTLRNQQMTFKSICAWYHAERHFAGLGSKFKWHNYTNAPSIMTYNAETDCYEKTYSLETGQQFLYKMHFHHNSSGTDYSWVSDPLNMDITSDGYANSILNVTNPLFFQPARHLNDDGMVDGLSVGVSTDGNVGQFTYSVGQDEPSSGGYIFENNVFYVPIDPPRSLFESYDIAVSINGQSYMHTRNQHLP